MPAASDSSATVDLGPPGSELLQSLEQSSDSSATVDLGPLSSDSLSALPNGSDSKETIDIGPLVSADQDFADALAAEDISGLPAPAAPAAPARGAAPLRGTADDMAVELDVNRDLASDPALQVPRGAQAVRRGGAVGSGDEDNLLAPTPGIADLPRPVSQPRDPVGTELGASGANTPGAFDLGDIPDLLEPVPGAAAADADLLEPVGGADLLAPVPDTAAADADLLEPIGGADLLEPIGGADLLEPIGGADLLEPIGGADLLEPVPGAAAADADLLEPIGGADLLEPIGGADLLEPIGGADLLEPIGGADLLEPAGAQNSPATENLPSPEGFFDNLPDTANVLDQPGGDDFFGDIGLPSEPAAPPPPLTEPAAVAPSPSNGDAGDAADFFDSAQLELSGGDPGIADAPATALSLANVDGAPAPPAASPFEMNALELGTPSDTESPEPLALDRSGPNPGLASPLGEPNPGLASPLGDAGSAAGAPGDLGLETSMPLSRPADAAPTAAADADASAFDGMDLGLEMPPLPGQQAADNDAAAGPAPVVPIAAASPGLDDANFGGLDLPSIPAASDEPPAASIPASIPTATNAAKPARMPPRTGREKAAALEKEEEVLGLEETAVPLVPQGIVAANLTQKHQAARRAMRKRIITAVSLVAVLGLGTGGFFAFSRWQEEQQRTETIQRYLGEARSYLQQGTPGHWERASAAGQKILEVVPNHPDGLGIAAEASYAALLDEGTNAEKRRREGANWIQQIDKTLVDGIHVDKAQALKSIDLNRPQPAIQRLQAVLSRQPNDLDASLYLGWAHAVAGDHERAAQAFQKALELTPKRKIPPLYGLAQAQLALGTRDDAATTFAQILELDKNHVGALIGAAAAADIGGTGDQSARYMAVLARPDIENADPRAVSRAWALAGEHSLRSGRIEEAKLRFGNAVDKSPDNLVALVGTAKVALLQERFDDARKALESALGTAPDNVDAILTAADLEIRSSKLGEATKFVDRILARKDDIDHQEHLVRAYLLRGRIFEVEDKQTDAIAAFRQARQLAGNNALEPAVALAKVLTRAGQGDEARAVLQPINNLAEADPAMAITLGILYTDAGALEDAETWFRKAIEMRPDDLDAQFRLGNVFIAQERYGDAIAVLDKALRAAPNRAEIGVTLAALYEKLKRDAAAGATYARMIAAGTESVDVLTRAGHYYARTRNAAKAGEMGAKLLKLSQPSKHPAGLFLLGESQYQSGDFGAALGNFQEAVNLDRTPEYLEALARALEKTGEPNKALLAFEEAAMQDPQYLAPRLGQARVLITHGDYDKAFTVLEDALALDRSNPIVHLFLGDYYQTRDDHKRAITHLRLSLRRQPKNPLAHFKLGTAYYELSNLREAARSFTRATQLARNDDPWLSKAYLELGYVQRSRRKRRQAVRAWENYLALVEKQGAGKSAEVREVKRLLMGLRAQTR